MRLTDIETIKAERRRASQSLYPAPADLMKPLPPNLERSNLRHRLVQAISPWLLGWKMHRFDREFGYLLPGCRFTCGYRFSDGWAWKRFEKVVGGWSGRRVLLPGSQFNTLEARRWFNRPVQELHLLDIVDWGPSFDAARDELQRLSRPKLSFHHGTLDKLPLPDGSVDLIESRAVLEHVGNMAASVAEMSRVLASGGLMFHAFGPLYFCHGGDHCIGSYGMEHGYDHLLLDEEAYTARLLDEGAFNSFGKEAFNSRYWAIQQIFSYLRPNEYLAAFSPHFEFVESLAIICQQALAFRQARPDLWNRLLESGLHEADLLIGGMFMIMKKKDG